MAEVTFTVNETAVTTDVDDDERLVEVLRDRLGLTGTVVGCGWGECGACSVLVDAEVVPACTTPAADLNGHAVTTVEGLADGDDLHPMQRAFLRNRALQCGYCTPGMLIVAVAAADRHGELDQSAARAAIAGNMCRCTGYAAIIDAIVDGSRSSA